MLWCHFYSYSNCIYYVTLISFKWFILGWILKTYLFGEMINHGYVFGNNIYLKSTMNEHYTTDGFSVSKIWLTQRFYGRVFDIYIEGYWQFVMTSKEIDDKKIERNFHLVYETASTNRYSTHVNVNPWINFQWTVAAIFSWWEIERM